MIEQHFILLIISCEKYRFKIEKQVNGWLKEIEKYNINNLNNKILFFHIVGNPSLNEEYLIDKIDNILYIKINDDYNSLPKKVIKAFQIINNIYKFKYIFKTDDDQNLLDIQFIINLQKILLINSNNNEDKRIHYGGQIINIDKPYLSQYHILHPELPPRIPLLQTQYCSGRFYFLSNNAVKYLITKEKNIIKEYLEDYAIGYNLHTIFKNNILNLNTNKYFIDFN